MLRLNARNKENRGFTLLENTIIVVMMGILLALSTPSLLSMVDRVRLNQAVADVRGALLEAQRQAIRKSVPCTITLNTSHGKVTGACLVTGDRKLPEKIKMVTNLASNTSNVEISFGILGTAEFNIIQAATPFSIVNDPSGKIVFYIFQGSTQNRKCIAISNTLGLTRVGDYRGPLTGPDITRLGVCTTAAA
jgi:type II secretory pathway pseudopilin PulG